MFLFVAMHTITQPIKRLQFAAMWFMNISFLSRPCDLTYYCPLLKDVVLPTDTKEWDNDGFPKYIQIAFLDSKGDLSGRPYRQLLKRNYVHTQYCPVMRMLAYLFFSGIDMKGQSRLFVKLDDKGMIPIHNGEEAKMIRFSGRDVMCHYSTETPKTYMNMSNEQYNEIHSHVFASAAHLCPDTQFGNETAGILLAATLYSDRKSATKWAARSKASQAQVKAAGHWSETSNEFQKYMEEGMTKEECLDVHGGTDEILLTWTFKTTTYTGLNSGEYRRANVAGKRRRLMGVTMNEEEEEVEHI